MKCADCRYFEPYGICRRFPPVPLFQTCHASFPTVGDDSWCGEFKKKDKPSQPDMFEAPKDKKGTRLTKEWVLDAEIGNWALGQGLTVEEVLKEEEAFRDYWIGVPGVKGVKLDWDATWRNRIRKVVEYKKEKAFRNGQK